MQRESFGSRLGFLLVSAGCAIGIGNVWRFPYITGKNGGGYFVLFYLVCLLLLGVPVMTMELAVGRGGRKSAVLAYKNLEKPGSKWHLHGWFCLAGCYLLMMYYTTVTGWMVNYFGKFLTGGFHAGMTGDEISGMFGTMLGSPGSMAVFTELVVVTGLIVCSFGLQKGLERVTKVMMIALLAIMVVLAVNKMDLVDFDKNIFDKIVSDYKEFVAPLNIPDITCIPLSALDGDNVVEKSDRTPWYEGPSLLDFLETVHIDNDHNFTDFRFPVQYVLRPNLDFRGFCGKVASGIVRKGDTVMALPSGKTSKVKSIVTYDGELDYAFPPQSVTLTLEDEIDVSRGEMLVHPDNLPIVDRNFEAMMVWMDEEPMDINKSFFIKQTTNLSRTRIDAIKYKVDVNTMEHLSIDNGQLTKDNLPLQLNQIARVVLTTAKELFFDPYKKNKSCGSFILIDPITNNTSAVGMIIDRVEMKDMAATDDIPVLDLSKLDIAPEHHAAIEKAVKELERQGLSIKVIK